jgi:hypothetical protein
MKSFAAASLTPLFFLWLGMVPFTTFAQKKPPKLSKSPVFYDNDDHRDVYTDEYLLALAHLGEIHLRAVTTTYTPDEYEEFVEGRKRILALAAESGMLRIPEYVEGTSQKLSRPASNLVEDTEPLSIPASEKLVELARKASAKKPLLVITGGQLTSVANAYLLDPTIGSRVVVAGVFGGPQSDYNADLDAWAWAVVLAKFRVVSIPIGPPVRRAIVYMKPPRVPKAQIRESLNQKIPFFAWMLEKKHPTNELPLEADFDGHPAIWSQKQGYITEWSRYTMMGTDETGFPILTTNKRGDIWVAEDADQKVATEEFWRVMLKLNKQLSRKLPSVKQ